MKSKYWAVIILTALAIVACLVYYVRQPAEDVGLITAHHQAKPQGVPASAAPAASSTAGETEDWKTYTNSQFGFSLSYNPQLFLGNQTKLGVVINPAAEISYDPVADDNVTLYLYTNTAKFRSQIYNPVMDNNDAITYSSSNKEFVVTAEQSGSQCPTEKKDAQNLPYYLISDAIHAGSSILVYVTTKGLVVLAGGPGSFIFNNPQMVLTAGCSLNN